MTLSSRAQPMASSDFARQLLYSAGFEDIQAAQLNSLPEFSQTLPGDCCILNLPWALPLTDAEQGFILLQWYWQHADGYVCILVISLLWLAWSRWAQAS